jgi:uncharacterized repeat protein (TIGR01451 family)
MEKKLYRIFSPFFYVGIVLLLLTFIYRTPFVSAAAIHTGSQNGPMQKPTLAIGSAFQNSCARPDCIYLPLIRNGNLPPTVSDLSIAFLPALSSADPLVINPGSIKTYYFEYQNFGPQSASKETIHINLSSPLIFYAPESAPGWTSAGGPGGYSLSLNSLAVGAKGQTYIAFTTSSAISYGITSAVVTASIENNTSNASDPVQANNQVSFQDTLASDHDLLLSAVLNENEHSAFILPGDTAVYSITTKNLGSWPAHNVVLTETIPPHTRFNSLASSSDWQQIGESDNYLYIAGDLAAGASKTVAFAITVNQDDWPQTACKEDNTLIVSEAQGNAVDITPSNNGLSLSLKVPIPVQAASINDLINTIKVANANPGCGYQVSLSQADYSISAVDNGINGFPVITGQVLIEGNQSSVSRVTTGPKFRFFTIATGAILELRDLSFANGYAYPNAGTILNEGLLYLNHVTIQNSFADGGTSGAVYNSGTTLINTGTFTGNYSTRQGGAIYNNGGTLLIRSSTFSNNSNSYLPGIIYSESGNVILNDTSFSANLPYQGILLSINRGVFKMINSTITGTQKYPYSFGNGQVIQVVGADLEISGSRIYDNPGAGGIYLAWYPSAVITNSQVFGNYYGGILIDSGDPANLAQIHSSCIIGNGDNANKLPVFVNQGKPGTVDATNNYWGAPDGPSGSGLGHGDSISSEVAYAPFMQAPPAGCPAEVPPFIVSVSISHNGYEYVDVNSSGPYLRYGGAIDLMPFVQKGGPADTSVNWQIVSGGGALSATSGQPVTFTAPNASGLTVIEAASVLDPSKTAQITIRTAVITLYYYFPRGNVLVNGNIQLRGWDFLDGTIRDQLSNVEAFLVNGVGSFSGFGYQAPGQPGTAVVRVRSLVDPSVYQDFPITVADSGVHACVNSPYGIGPNIFTTSGGAHAPNQPTIYGGSYSEVDVLPGENQTFNVKARVLSPGDYPITSMTITYILDNGTYGPFPMTLVSGSGLDGTWSFTWAFQDSHCQNYEINIILQNSVLTSNFTAAFR